MACFEYKTIYFVTLFKQSLAQQKKPQQQQQQKKKQQQKKQHLVEFNIQYLCYEKILMTFIVE